MNGFSAFQDALPNNTHFYLAQLLHRGATIVTTNYDLCIPKAYAQMYSYKGVQLKRRQLARSIFEYYAEEETVGKLYYVHGIADRIESLGYSLKIVMRSLSGIFYEEIQKRYQDNHLFIFLGYSGLDNLDVNPMLESLYKQERSAEGICIVYPESNYTDAQKLLMSYFHRNSVYNLYLQEFFELFQDLYGFTPNIQKWGSTISWEKNFKPYPKVFHVFIQMALAYELGISYKVNKKIDREYIEPYMEKWYLKFYTEHLEVFSSFWKTLWSCFSNNFDKYRKIVTSANVEGALDSSVDAIDWSIVTPINATVKLMLKKYSIHKLLVPKEEIEKMYNITNSLIQYRKYEDFEEVREYYVLELCFAMLIAMRGTSASDVHNIIRGVAEEYSKVSILDGVLNAELVYLKTQFIMLKKEGTWNEWKQYRKRVHSYFQLMKRLKRRDRVVKFWIK